MYPVLTGSGPFDRKLRNTRENSSRVHHFQHIMVVLRLFHVSGLFEYCFREPVERTQSSECRFENSEHKK